MGVKLDRFTWIAIGVVLLLVVAAALTVTLTSGRGWEDGVHVDEDDPASPVVNAFLALEEGDLYAARTEYSQQVLDEIARQNYDPFTGRAEDRGTRRLRIVEQETDPNDADRALVTFIQDGYSRGGPFGSGNTWSRRAVIEVVREEGAWKINTQEFFY